MAIRLVVFDMAGTTVHDGDAVHTALCEALRTADTPVSRDEANEVMGLPKPLAIRQLLERKAEATLVTEAFVQQVHNDFLERMIAYYRTNPAVREVAGAAEVFRQLRAAGIKVALDTGFSRPIVDTILARLGWNEGLLDATVSSDEVARGRPHPDMIFRAMERTGIQDVKAVAKVGDTPSDLHEGTSAGCGLVIGVTGGSHTREQLESHPHTHLLHTIVDLPTLLLSESSATPP